MSTSSELSPILRGLLLVAQEVSVTHGIPVEAVLFQTLAHGSALAGHLISSKPVGKQSLPAKFSALFLTGDSQIPAWINDELAHLQRRQNEILQPAKPVIRIPVLRRRKRAIAALNPDDDHAGDEVGYKIDLLKRSHAYRYLHVVGGRTSPPTSKRIPSMALLASGYPAYRKILASRGKADGYAARIDAGRAERSNVFGWIANADWERLTREAGSHSLSKLGWTVGCPASSYCPDSQVASRLAGAAMLQRLEIARFGAIRFSYQPCVDAKALLDRQVEQGFELAATLSAALSGHVMPDSFLPWHLSAILAALCCDGKGEAVERSIHQATRVGIAIAAWVARQHVHRFRHAFPADADGLFTGQDLSVYRFLRNQPASVRDFQRRLRNVSNDSCLRSLQRAVAAGLAVETSAERFSVVPFPSPGGELSEFLSEFDPQRIFPLGDPCLSTDGTDKTTLSATPAGFCGSPPNLTSLP